MRAGDIITLHNERARRATPVRLVRPWGATRVDGTASPGWQVASVVWGDASVVPDRVSTSDILAGSIKGCSPPISVRLPRHRPERAQRGG